MSNQRTLTSFERQKIDDILAMLERSVQLYAKQMTDIQSANSANLLMDSTEDFKVAKLNHHFLQTFLGDLKKVSTQKNRYPISALRTCIKERYDASVDMTIDLATQSRFLDESMKIALASRASICKTLKQLHEFAK